jgi:hypothetical protein
LNGILERWMFGDGVGKQRLRDEKKMKIKYCREERRLIFELT